ncbi:MAG: hypothetical protein HKO10_09830 [Acidimicrobiia bacterium]|nr:hypothetical protein [Acidimicrobiia bacterium]
MDEANLGWFDPAGCVAVDGEGSDQLATISRPSAQHVKPIVVFGPGTGSGSGRTVPEMKCMSDFVSGGEETRIATKNGLALQ